MARPARTWTRTAAVAMASLGAVLAACGDDDGDDQAVADPQEAAAGGSEASDPPDGGADDVPDGDDEECALVSAADVGGATGIPMEERDAALPPGLDGIEGAPVVCEFEIDTADDDDHSSVSVMYAQDPPEGFFNPPEDSTSAGLGDDSYAESGSWQAGEDSHCSIEVVVGGAQVSVWVSADTDIHVVANGEACSMIAEHVLDRI